MRTWALRLLAPALTAFLIACQTASTQHHATDPALAIDDDDLGGVVTSANGPEAGVWVIAETKDLPTNFIKIVVTDDQGRVKVPELPAANYIDWVRGNGQED